ncbi:glucan phosphoethanolaminetransferase (alkaline phosphatase superfamily) [Nitrobacteraceae bacterium AZCC 1564]
MTRPDVAIPKHIFYFEVLLYLSLLLDSLSMAFRRDAFNDLGDMAPAEAKLITAVLLLFLVYLVWLAAHRRQNWARMVLLVLLVMSVISVAAMINETGWQLATFVDFISAALTAAGLFFSFTGDAQGWFAPSGGRR